jgi:hypothetical protein
MSGIRDADHHQGAEGPEPLERRGRAHDAPELTEACPLDAAGATVVVVVVCSVVEVVELAPVDDPESPELDALPAVVLPAVVLAVVVLAAVVLDVAVLAVTVWELAAVVLEVVALADEAVAVVWLARLAKATVPTIEPPASQTVATRARRSPPLRDEEGFDLTRAMIPVGAVTPLVVPWDFPQTLPGCFTGRLPTESGRRRR